MKEHTFKIQTQYTGGLAGVGKLQTASLESSFSAPKELGGAGQGTNPEELLASAASSCFLITLGAILQFQKITTESFFNRTEIETIGEGPDLKVKSIRHFPTVLVAKGTQEESKLKIQKALTKAEVGCIIAQALKGNVAISIQPKVEEVR